MLCLLSSLYVCVRVSLTNVALKGPDRSISTSRLIPPNLFSGIVLSLHSHRLIVQNWIEVCRINHGVCLARRVQMHLFVCVCVKDGEKTEKKVKIFFVLVRLLRLISLIHMLRQIKQFLPRPRLFSCWCTSRNAENEPFYTLSEQTSGTSEYWVYQPRRSCSRLPLAYPVVV